ncbi:MAG: hypothetical protein ACR2JP_01555 [Acidimicrobiia bacterium]
MKGNEASGPIRTLPPITPEAAGGGHRSSAPPDRRWIPLAAVAAAIAVFTAIGIFESAPPQQEAQQERTSQTAPSLAGDASPTTTSAPDAPSLAALIPGLDHSPTVLFRPDGDRTAVASWYLRSSEPRTSITWGANSVVAALDAARSLVMAVTNEGASTLWVGSAPVVAPAFIDIGGAAWHPTDPGRLAFVGRAPGSDAYHLYTAQGRSTGGITDLVDLGRSPGRAELVAWGDWGFLLSRLVEPSLRLWEVPDLEDDEGATTSELLHIAILLDADGRPHRSFPGLPAAVGPNGEMVIQPRIASYRAAIAAGHTDEELGFVGEVMLIGERDLGLTTAVVVGPDQIATSARFLLDQRTMASGAVGFVFTPDGAAVAMVAHQDGRMVVTTSHLHSNSTIRTFVDADRVIGFSRDGVYLITQNEEAGHLLLLDWIRGSSVRIPFTLGRVFVFDI